MKHDLRYKTQMKKYILIVIALMGCSAPENSSVNVTGNLRAIMLENKTEATINLNDLPRQSDLFAIGAIEGLSGEILIMDGKVFTSRVTKDTFQSITAMRPKQHCSCTLM
ncbi:MAG: hypothetical protein HC811_11715 [Flammeovirgaceae bacterium]|nr:hypothetical protein [Flammeovirgaceae bacterium]